ncbi:MAG: hypothetical protein M3N98_01750 [Actinomycetota bacterium]|nr:hypothetical protein [Actinomycetota bacterium]
MAPTVVAPPADDLDDVARIVSRIAGGDHDDDIDRLIVAINGRVRLLEAMATTRARLRLHIGDRVRLNDNVSPRYLVGQTGDIHEITDDYIVVCLDRPMGRFKSGHIRCAPTGSNRYSKRAGPDWLPIDKGSSDPSVRRPSSMTIVLATSADPLSGSC